MARLVIYLTLLATLASLALPESPPAPAPAEPEPEPEPRQAEGGAGAEGGEGGEEPPEGYYAFVESPNATPPRVRPPPYQQVDAECPSAGGARPHVTASNLCGDLNRGAIPRSPVGRRQPGAEPYPFELIRNHTLRFLSRTLPVLRADDTLPRVAHLASPPPSHQHYELQGNGLEEQRSKRSADQPPEAVPSHALRAEHRTAEHPGQEPHEAESPRESRKFCDGGGVLCMLYRAINGDGGGAPAGVERREDPGPHSPHGPHPAHPVHPAHPAHPAAQPLPAHPRYEGPPTPCPARVEYATPVFARNYQGVWRYVVQIPYEGYFTQTVEVTRCMQSRCHYLEGGCLSSPRWVSLLVAELHYPQEYQQQQYLQKRSGPGPQDAEPSTEKPMHCDGHDELGCFQVRLYYDWFLVPGSCKCWRPDYFARYVRRRHSTNEL